MKQPAKPRNPVVVALLKAPRHAGAHATARRPVRQKLQQQLRRHLKGEEVFHSRAA